MSENAVVRARVSEEVKQEATEVLAEMGLTVSDVLRMTLKRVARDRTLPFDLTPNAETTASIEMSERGEGLTRAKDIDELFKKLGI
jgi:DNA-damage-inducible protein J